MAVIVTETHVTRNIEDSEISVEGYNPFIVYSDSRHTGGVTIYVKNCLKCETLTTYERSKEYWGILVKLNLLKEKVILGGVYRSPNGIDIADFFNKFESSLDADYIIRNSAIIAEDFNINMLENSQHAKRLLNITNTCGFKQIVTKPTRCTKDSKTLVDHVYTNFTKIKETDRKYPIISDHETIGLQLDYDSAITETRKYFRNLHESNLQEIRLELIGQEWDYISTDVNYLYTNFRDNIKNAIEKISPQKEVFCRRGHEWIDDEIRQEQKERDRLYNTFKFTNSINYFEDYKKQRNKVVALIRKKEKDYYEKKISENRQDSKKMWKTLKQIVNKNKQSIDYSCIDTGKRSENVENSINNFL